MNSNINAFLLPFLFFNRLNPSQSAFQLLLPFYFININDFRLRCSRKRKLHCFFKSVFLLFLFLFLWYCIFYMNWLILLFIVYSIFTCILLLLNWLHFKWICISFFLFIFQKDVGTCWLFIGNSFIQIFPGFWVILWVFWSTASVRSTHWEHISKPPSYFLTHWNFVFNL